jgi:hypothetical protein
MSLQWYSPAEAAVADLVRGHSGITPTKWECFEALDRNRDGSYLDAADELLWKYAVERQQLDALSPTERMVADIVRNKTGYVPTQHECGFYLQLHNDNIQNAATGVRNEYNRAQTRHEEEQALWARHEEEQALRARFRPSTGGMPFLDAFLSRESMPTPTVDLATERFRATGGIGEQMVRTEEDVAAVRDFEIGSQLTSTNGASAYLPGGSTATSLASASSNNPELQALVAAITSDVPVSPTKSGGEASDGDATGALKKTSDGKPLCFFYNDEGSQALSTDERPEIAWFAKGTTHSVNPHTGLSSPLTFERMRKDVNVHSSQPTHTRRRHYVFLGSQKRGAQDTKGFLHRRLPNRGAGETGVALCVHASSHAHTRTHLEQAPTLQPCMHVRRMRARSDFLSVQMPL